VTPEAALDLLSRHLPQAVLLLGPGAWELGTELGQVYGLQETVSTLDAETARRLRSEVQFIPPHPPLVYLIGLDGASIPAQNMLLKVLEEPPPWARLILAATAEPLRTIVSRCQVVPLGNGSHRAEPDPQVKGQVATVVRAARTGSLALLAQALKGWTPLHSQLLQDWAFEVAAERWETFDAGFAPGVTPGEALDLLTVLSRYAGSKLAPQVALTEVFCHR
jgi:hypothetical protein